MAGSLRYRGALFTAGFVLSVALVSAAAPADMQMIVGARTTVASKPVSDCSSRAKSALDAVLHNSNEAGDGSGIWIGGTGNDSSGNPTATATIQCLLNGDGYVVTFTCAVQVPPSPDTATGLCTKLTTAFGS